MPIKHIASHHRARSGKNKISEKIQSLKKKKIFKHKKKILWFFCLFVVVLAALFYILWKNLSNNKNKEIIQDQSAGEKSANVPATTTRETFASFFDSFSLETNIDKENTNLYQDKVANAVYFPPDYSWQMAAATDYPKVQSQLENTFNNEFKGPYVDKRCLRSRCLEQKGLELIYNGRLLAWPKNIDVENIEAVSIAALQKRWLVGITFREGDKFRGEVLFFDGRKFSELASPIKINSQYFGLFGFGGDEDDFLVIYGAYQGQAYRVRGSELTMLDKFFDIRVMADGFKPEVIKTSYGSNVNWYVYSSTLQRPRLIKLWQNRTQEIVGEAAFNLFSPSDKAASFAVIKASRYNISLLAKIDSGDGSIWKNFIDYGFKNNFEGVLNFKPISRDINNTEIIMTRIDKSWLDLDKSSQGMADLFLSFNGQEWKLINGLKNYYFTTPKVKHFFLKVALSEQNDKFYSPFLESLGFDYYCTEEILAPR